MAGLRDQPGEAFKVLSAIAKAGVNVDVIIQNNERDGTNDMSFTVALPDVDHAASALEARRDAIGYKQLLVDTNIAKVSVVGAGMMSSVGIAALVFEAFNDEKINIQMISTSEIKISCIIDKASADRAVAAIHRKFFES